MNSKNRITRRFILKSSASFIAAAASFTALASNKLSTPQQAEGPFYPIKSQQDKDLDLTLVQGRSDRAQGEVVEISGVVIDESGNALPNVIVDIWQANAAGRYSHEQDSNVAALDSNFQGWGIVKTDEKGFYRFKTIKPGAYPAEKNWIRPPHIHFKVSKRGYWELITQMYFVGERLNDTDALLQKVPKNQQQNLIVEFSSAKGQSVPQGVFNIVLAKV
jgi:protocatechuate 3,4-dioxygenase beta subunit